jgi:hypothetical protein
MVATNVRQSPVSTHKMRVLIWNCRGASVSSAIWDYLQEISPDIALLQEVGAVPSSVTDNAKRERQVYDSLASINRSNTRPLEGCSKSASRRRLRQI